MSKNIKVMVVPGAIVDVVIADSGTVIDAAKAAQAVKQDIDFVGLAKGREVRVNKRKFSNSDTVNADQGYAGSIFTTALSNGDVVLILTKIAGNEAGVLTCYVNGEGYALESPDTIANTLINVVGINPNDVVSVTVDGEAANLADLVGDEDYIEIVLAGEEVAAAGSACICVNGEEFVADAAGKLAAIKAIASL